MKKQNGAFQSKLPYISARPSGNLLPYTMTNAEGSFRPVINQAYVRVTEPYGTKVPTKELLRASGWSQIANLSHEFDMEKVQSALRAAERGDLTLMWTFIRDFFISNPTVVACLTKRKLSTLSENYSILPANKANKDDVINSEIIREILNRTPSFLPALSHMLNATVYPLAGISKVFKAVDADYGDNKYGLRYCIKDLSPIRYELINFRLPYLPIGPINIGNQPVVPSPPMMQNMSGRPEDTIFDPDSWSPELRFWSVLDNGLINYNYAYMMAPDPERHIIYRSNLLNGIAPENFGGVSRAILFLAIMSQIGLNNYLNCLNRWGVPFVVGKVDMSQTDTVNKIYEAFDKMNVLHALAINKDAEIELMEANSANISDGHTKFLEYIDKKIELIIQGETLSSDAKSTGLGSGTANLHGDVRQDYIHFDRICLDTELSNGLFKQLLEINGRGGKGSAPHISWGGGQSVQENKDLSITLLNMYNAGIQPQESAMDELSKKLGFPVERMGVSMTPPSTNNKETPPTKKPEPASDKDTDKDMETVKGQQMVNAQKVKENAFGITNKKPEDVGRL